MTTAQEEFAELMRDKGRRTNHPDDDSDGGARLGYDHSDDSDRTPPPEKYESSRSYNPRPSMSLSRANIPRTRYAANTGPKGVIADAQAYRDSQRLHRQSRPVNGTSMRPPVGQSNGISGKGRIAEDEEEEKLSDDEDEYDDDDDDDEDFMLEWRQSRLRELQTGMRDIKARSHDRFRPTWSGMSTVDGNGYLHAIERSPPETAVLVYIYDDQSDVSADIEACLRDLAPLHPSVRFVRLHYHAAEMEPAGVPALLAYRGGDMFAGLVPVVDEIPDDAELSAETLETVLRKYQIL